LHDVPTPREGYDANVTWGYREDAAMADLALEHIGNTAEQRTWLIATPHNLGPDHLMDFVGENILEVKPGTSLVNSQHSNFGGIFARGSRSGVGVVGQGTNNAGVYGWATNASGVVGEARNTNGAGVLGRNDGGTGVHGQSRQLGYSGVYGQHLGSGYGVVGDGAGSAFAGVLGRNASPEGAGVRGEGGDDHNGVLGTANNGTGVRGFSRSWMAVIGISETGTGVRGQSSGTDGVALFGWGKSGAKAGIFQGDVEVRGNLTVVNGNKPFKIDHPLDPQNKYLLHNAVEAPERKNVYDGLAQLDEDGAASVDLPGWFEALNGDFRYQLTAVGGAAPNLHVAEEVSGNRFKIAGGEGGMKVCWQVTGSRKDPWAAANPFEIEQEKPQEERGRYLQPDLYGAPEEQSVMRARMGAMREPPPAGFEPPTALAMPPGVSAPGFEPPTAPAIPPDVGAPGIGRIEEEHRQQIDELRGQIEELKRVSLEEEIDELKRQIKKLQRRRKR
jgi:hypothetical protein